MKLIAQVAAAILALIVMALGAGGQWTSDGTGAGGPGGCCIVRTAPHEIKL